MLLTSRAFYCSLYPFSDRAFVNNLPTQPVGTSFISFNVALTWKLLNVHLELLFNILIVFVCLWLSSLVVQLFVVYKLCIPVFKTVLDHQILYANYWMDSDLLFNFIVVGNHVRQDIWLPPNRIRRSVRGGGGVWYNFQSDVT